MSSRLGRILLQQSRRAFPVRATTPVLLAPLPTTVRATVVARQPDLARMRRWLSDKASAEEPVAEEEEAPASASGAEAAQETVEETKEGTGAETVAAKSEDVAKLEAQVKDLKDQLLRSLAEQDNTRRIAKRDVDAASQFAIKSFAKSLLDTSDNLTRAMEAVPEEVRTDKENNAILANLYEGIEMTERGLMKAFESNGLVKFGQPGEPFDPNKHEALYEYVDPEKEAGTIGQVMKSGFLLRDRVLRPAEVGVVKKE